MKPIRLLTSMLAAGAVVLASCSAPRLAQQSSDTDDVYNSVAQATEYVQPAPSQSSQYKDDSVDREYGTSDPYYDMDYSSRINRFYYGSPFRSYYDPYYYDYYGYNGFSPWYSGFNLGFGWGWGNSFYGNYWNSPYYGWGIYSPYYAWNPFYGGGYLGGYYGGYYGGGYLGGGYVNRLPGNTIYGARPDRSRSASSYSNRTGTGSIGRGTIRTNNGVMTSDRSRAERYNPNRNSTARPAPSSRTNRSRETYRTPQRSNTESRPTYSPPRSSNTSSGTSGGGGGGGGSRSQRSGGRN